MCGRNTKLILLSALLVFCLVPLSLWGQDTKSPSTQVTSSTPTSPQVEQLWQTLHDSTQSLPKQYQSFVDNLQAQVTGLQKTNSSLALQNQDLTNYLATSEIQAATLADKSKQLQTDLTNSTNSTIKAQNDAKGLELQVAWLKVGCISFGVGFSAFAVYEGGRALKLW